MIIAIAPTCLYVSLLSRWPYSLRPSRWAQNTHTQCRFQGCSQRWGEWRLPMRRCSWPRLPVCSMRLNAQGKVQKSTAQCAVISLRVCLYRLWFQWRVGSLEVVFDRFFMCVFTKVKCMKSFCRLFIHCKTWDMYGCTHIIYVVVVYSSTGRFETHIFAQFQSCTSSTTTICLARTSRQ